MKFKLVEKFNLSEDVFFHKAYRDKNGNVVDDQGVPINPKVTPDLAKRFSPFWDKADDDIIDPSEYSPFTDGVYPDWNTEADSISGSDDTDGTDNTDELGEPGDIEKEKRKYSKNSTKKQGSGSGGGRGGQPPKDGDGDQKDKGQSDEDKRIFIDTSTGKRYKKIDNKYVEI